MDKEHKDPYKLDLTEPRLAWYKQNTWKRHQDTVYWVDIQLAQRKGLKFHQTRSNEIILYVTLPAFWIPEVVVVESGEIISENVYMTPRPPPKISFKDDRMKELDSEVAGSSKDTQRIQPKPKKHYHERGDPWVSNRTGDRKKCLVWSRRHQKLNKNGETCDGPPSIQSFVPVSVELVENCQDKDENVDADQTRTESEWTTVHSARRNRH